DRPAPLAGFARPDFSAHLLMPMKRLRAFQSAHQYLRPSAWRQHPGDAPWAQQWKQRNTPEQVFDPRQRRASKLPRRCFRLGRAGVYHRDQFNSVLLLEFVINTGVIAAE